MKNKGLKIATVGIFICAIALNFTLSKNLNHSHDRVTLEGQKAQAYTICEPLYFDVLVCCESGGTTCNALGYYLKGPYYY